MTRHSIVVRSRPTSPFNDQDFIYIYTHSSSSSQLTLSFLFPEKKSFSLCKFFFGREKGGRSDRHAFDESRFLSTDLVLFLGSCSFPLAPSGFARKTVACQGERKRKKKGQADAVHRYLDDKSNELIVFN